MYKISGPSTTLSGILNTFMALELVQYSAYDLSHVLVMAAQVWQQFDKEFIIDIQK